ncbi:MAG: 5-histidylcysteine sulfoxide synthase [Microcystaceae cyanobacterium]
MNPITSIHPPRLDHLTNQTLLAYFQEAWQLEDRLLNSIISSDTFYLNPDPLRNPLIFYVGHSAVFYVNKLIQVDLLSQRINPDYEILFEIGVDPETPEELNEAIQKINWPSIDQVWQYREKIYHLISQIITNLTIDFPIEQAHPIWALMMSIEHQRIHIDTSSMLIRQLPSAQVKRPLNWHYAPTDNHKVRSKMIEVEGGTVILGKGKDFPLYGWDIEYGCLPMEVDSFLVSNYLVTNGEFLDFVKAGGYEQSEYWDSESWQWKQNNKMQHPKFWLPQDNDYNYRAMFDEISLPLDWPVEVNYYEAMAYCRWKGSKYRLMTEAEWKLATYGQQDGLEASAESQTNHYNLNVKWGSPSPVGYAEQEQTEVELYDMRGNVWQWLETTFVPLPGFKPHRLYEDFSLPFFDNNHKMMLGGSWITQGTQALKFYRNWFRPYFYQHAGFRLAQDIN